MQKAKEKGKDITQMNAESQSKTKRDRKTFLSEQCKEVEKDNRMEKIRDLFQKIGDIKATFHAKMVQ